MFGYIIVNKPEMKFKEFDFYQSYYCGLCKTLQEQYGRRGQITLSYDMTFLILLLTSLYEPETIVSSQKCMAHPFEKHPARINQFSRYAADINLLLSYYKCLDDWIDEHKLSRKIMATSLQKKYQKIVKQYPVKAELIQEKMKQIHQFEQEGSRDMDKVSGCFGEIMGEIFVWRKDEWEADLRKMGFFLGKFIYLMDAYEDIEKDEKTGNYNLFLDLFKQSEEQNRVPKPISQLEKQGEISQSVSEFGADALEKKAEMVLSMMMAECSRAFERLPIVENIEILRNILYSGVWCRYELVKEKRERK